MTRMMVGFMGIIPDSISSKIIPMIERKTMATSSWFHLQSPTAISGRSRRERIGGREKDHFNHRMMINSNKKMKPKGAIA